MPARQGLKARRAEQHADLREEVGRQLGDLQAEQVRSCDSPISTAMPLVKPMMMVTGM